MKLYQLHRKQTLPVSLEKAWEFFADPHNLSRITPEWLRFSICSPLSRDMYDGMIIEYKITLPPGIPTTWITEITHVRAPNYFVDEQRLGPYRFWHHQHHFRPVQGGVEMEDVVHYALPFGWIGQLVHRFKVHQQLQTIFDFRFNFLEQYFADLSETSLNFALKKAL